MANDKIRSNYKDIANAIRAKTGENGLITAEEMPDKISAIETGITPSGNIAITENTDSIDVTNYATASVNVEAPTPTGLDGDGIYLYNESDNEFLKAASTDSDTIITYNTQSVLQTMAMSENYAYCCYDSSSSGLMLSEGQELTAGSTYYYEGSGQFTEVESLEPDTLYATNNVGTPGMYGAEVQYEGGVYYVNSSYSGPMPTMFDTSDWESGVLQYNASETGDAILTKSESYDLLYALDIDDDAVYCTSGSNDIPFIKVDVSDLHVYLYETSSNGFTDFGEFEVGTMFYNPGSDVYATVQIPDEVGDTTNFEVVVGEATTTYQIKRLS